MPVRVPMDLPATLDHGVEIEHVVLSRGACREGPRVCGWRLRPRRTLSDAEERALLEQGFVRIGNLWYRRAS